MDTYEANLALGHREDERDYTAAAQMLQRSTYRRSACSATTSTKRATAAHGITVSEQLPTGVHMSAANSRYLAAKARRGDLLKLPG